MSIRELRVSSMCPICGEAAVSPHHITPVAAGGTDSSRNKVMLCKRCHDIMELIYDETGLEYCPALVRAVQREYELHPRLRISAGKRSLGVAFTRKLTDLGKVLLRITELRVKLFKPSVSTYRVSQSSSISGNKVICGRCNKQFFY